MKKNNGFTLIEFVIVLSIMAILAAMSLVSLSVIKQAKYTADANNLENSMSSLAIKTKAISQSRKNEYSSSAYGASADRYWSQYPLCMKIEEKFKSNGQFDGYSCVLGYNTDNTLDGFVPRYCVESSNGNYDLNANGEFVPVANGPYKEQEEMSISYVTRLVYKDTSVSGTSYDSIVETNSDSIQSIKRCLIMMDKSSGRVKYGAGRYELYYNDRVVSTVFLDGTTGKHYQE